ncbi:MAG TPA: hypothetical protein VFW40_05580, partial [Capsulimonadaceae bacterium]|nr:hypothetical protein [Capsulimonadaceae bacterium]
TTDGTTLQITTDGNIGQSNSAIYSVKQNIKAFVCNFTYQAQFDPNNSVFSPADGVTFVIENDSRGTAALGTGGSDLGYSGGFGITKSVAVAFNIWNGHVRGTNLLLGGKNITDTYLDTSPVDLSSGDPIDVTLSYDGASLTETLTDEVNSNTFTTSYAVSIPSFTGGLAYLGFTGGTGSGESTQTISNFSFTSNSALVLTPASLLGGASSKGAIHLTSPVSAKTVFTLTNSDPTNVTIPATVVVHAGQSSASFPITTMPVGTVDTVNISAQANGMTLPAILTVKPAKLVSQSVQIATNPIVGGNVAFAEISLNGPAPAGGATIQLGVPNNIRGAVTAFYNQDPNTAGAMTITSVTIPAGQTFADFAIQTNLVIKDTTVRITGTYNGVVQGAPLTVLAGP